MHSIGVDEYPDSMDYEEVDEAKAELVGAKRKIPRFLWGGLDRKRTEKLESANNYGAE